MMVIWSENQTALVPRRGTYGGVLEQKIFQVKAQFLGGASEDIRLKIAAVIKRTMKSRLKTVA